MLTSATGLDAGTVVHVVRSEKSRGGMDVQPLVLLLSVAVAVSCAVWPSGMSSACPWTMGLGVAVTLIFVTVAATLCTIWSIGLVTVFAIA